MIKKTVTMLLIAITYITTNASDIKVDFTPEAKQDDVKLIFRGQPTSCPGITGKGIELGGNSSLTIDLNKPLSASRGAVSFHMKPVDWTPENEHFIFFITLTGGPPGKGQSLMFYKFFNQPQAVLYAVNDQLKQKKSGFYSIKDWDKPVWRKITLSWNKGCVKAYIDKECIMTMPLPELQPEWNRIIMGPSRSWSHMGQELTAFSDLIIHEENIENDAKAAKRQKARKISKEMSYKNTCGDNEEILSTAAAGAIPIASDSIENRYNNMADCFIDGKAGTLWITGDAMNNHWAGLYWHNRNLTIKRVIATFKEQDFYWNKIDTFGTEPRKANKINGVTSIPEDFKLSCRVGSEWHNVPSQDYSIHWLENNVVMFDFQKPLQDASGLKLHFDTQEKEFAGLADLKVIGDKQSSSYALTPKWGATKWIWNKSAPICAKYEPIKCFFRKTFDVKNTSDIVRAELIFAIHDAGRAWLNGKLLGNAEFTGSGIKQNIVRVAIKPDMFKKGANILAIEGLEIAQVGLSGVLFKLGIEHKNGTETVIDSTKSTLTSMDASKDWQTALTPSGEWVPAREVTSADRRAPDIWSFDYTPLWCKGRIKLEHFSISPAIPEPGQKFTLKLDLKPESPLPENYNVVVKLGSECIAEPHRQYLSLGELTSSGTGALPQGLDKVKTVTLTGMWPAGTPSRVPAQILVCNSGSQAEFVPGQIGKLSDGNNPGRLNIFIGAPQVKLPAGYPEAKVVPGGRISIDGQLVPPILFTSSLLTMDRFQKYIEAGGRMFRIVPQGMSRIAFDGDQDAYIKRLLKNVENTTSNILQMAPDAKFILMLALDMPNTWNMRHTDDNIVLANGKKLLIRNSDRPDFGFLRETPNAPDVLKKLTDAMTTFVKEMEKQPYAHSIIGFTLAQGGSGENYWGIRNNIYVNDKKQLIISSKEEYVFGDFGISARKNLSKELRQKYKTDEKLAEAWKQPGLKFSDIEDPEKWKASDAIVELMWRNRPDTKFMFRDMGSEGSMFYDFVRHQNLARAQIFETAGKAIKEASGNRLLVGGFIGYSVCNLTNSPPALAQHTGHLMVDTLRKSKFFDFICSPHFYHMRRAGDPVITHGTSESMRLHDKIWMSEYDSRTYLSPIQPKTFSQQETREVQQKEFAYALSHSQGFWWLEFPFSLSGRQAPAWFTDSDFIKDSKVMHRVYSDYLKTEPENICAEVAVFLNEKQGFFTDAYSPGNTVHSNLANGLLPKLYMSGTTFDLYAQEDLEFMIKRGLHKKYKMMIFLNAFHISPDERQLINRYLKQDQRTLMFLFAPGYQGNPIKNGSELSVEGISEITGISGAKKLDKQAILGIEFDADYLKDIPGQPTHFSAFSWSDGIQKKFYGNEIGPVFYLDNKLKDNWESLGKLIVDSNVNPGKTALARKKFSDHTVIYSTVPNLPVKVLSNLVRNSGAHIYGPEGVIVYANDNFIAVHSGNAVSKCRIYAKKPCTWYEPFEHKEYAKNTKSLDIDLKAGETKFFELK